MVGIMFLLSDHDPHAAKRRMNQLGLNVKSTVLFANLSQLYCMHYHDMEC